MTKITPKRAAAEAEAWWQVRAKRQHIGNCSWCDFANSIADNGCSDCPIFRLTKAPCKRLDVYEGFSRAASESERRRFAGRIYELLVENRERLLEAAREILDEAK